MRAIRLQQYTWTGALLVLSLLTLGFAIYATALGWSGLTQDLTGVSRLYSDAAASNVAVFSHMVAGAMITLLAPIQVIPALRQRWPALHRGLGRVLVLCAVVAGLGGLGYIALQGTIGGAHMSIAFAVYGGLMLICAVQTLRHGRARRIVTHSDWALRLFVLAIGSWLYRVHYGLWDLVFGDFARADDFSGLFDQANLWAFFLPYLAGLEWVLWRRRRGFFTKGASA